ncbi:hypothetical protein APS56_00775 [Pseudalgibacter alginicilyticus]|uniref:Uncharacterized protein n=1 Tax=Pseudalgibacter alginicilyticus TaxID=1736674 RepID=A0A0P0CHK2_9FLAO|nr:DUF3857 domain-containing protein [Pseudalgibacter alginicilyticus]ALJ03771.1 hypothetical protein APS56_00775 [Pseudalgibacter alginicilyticus]
MKKVIFILFLLPCIYTYSQSKFNSNSYSVTLADIETNTFDKDSTANALVIYEEGNSYVDQSDYKLHTEIKRKIKILNKEGFDKATVSVYLYKNKNITEDIEHILATTYNKLNGKVIKTQLEKEHIYKEEYNENYTLVKFTLPNIKEGSVITYSYKLDTPFMFKYKGWNFQDDIPTLYSDYKTSIPGNWVYNIKLVGYKALDTNTSNLKKNCLEGPNGASADCSINHFAMKDIPAFIEEDYITNKYNYLARVEYELKTFRGFDGTVNDYTKTWESVDDELKAELSIGRQLSKSVNKEDFFNNQILSEPNTLKKAEIIYHYVQDNFTWNEEYNIFKDHTIKDLIKNKSGNVSSINILLHNLLKASKIDVKPVLISTRSNGFPTKIFPVISDFNYLIVQATINNKTYLLDATDPYLNFGQLPFRCLNKDGRLLDFKNGSKWIAINAEKPSSVLYKVQLNLDSKQDIIQGTVESHRTGYHALSSKKSYYSNNESYVKNLKNRFPNTEITNHIVNNKDKKNSSFTESYNIQYTSEKAGSNIYLNPFFVKFFKENPFKLQERTYPIDFGFKDYYNYIFSIDLGDDYVVLEKPENIFLKLPNDKGQLFFSTAVLNNTINISLRIDFKEPIYEIEYYPYLKEFMSKIVDIQNNSLILLKKK